jgi:hypothetical protein
MSDNYQLRYSDRPLLYQRFEQGGKVLPIVGDMPPGVVVQICGCVSQVTGQRLPMISPLAKPLQIIATEAMHKDQKLATDFWKGSR